MPVYNYYSSRLYTTCSDVTVCCINCQVAAVLFAIGGVALISLFSEKDKSTTVKNTPLGYVVSSGCVTWACHIWVCHMGQVILY